MNEKSCGDVLAEKSYSHLLPLALPETIAWLLFPAYSEVVTNTYLR